MNADTRDAVVHGVWGAVALAFVVGLVGMGIHCQRTSADVVKACLQAGKPPLECDRLMQGQR